MKRPAEDGVFLETFTGNYLKSDTRMQDKFKLLIKMEILNIYKNKTVFHSQGIQNMTN